MNEVRNVTRDEKIQTAAECYVQELDNQLTNQPTIEEIRNIAGTGSGPILMAFPEGTYFKFLQYPRFVFQKGKSNEDGQRGTVSCLCRLICHWEPSGWVFPISKQEHIYTAYARVAKVSFEIKDV